MRAFLALLLVFLLAACAAGNGASPTASAPPAGNWHIQKTVDRINDGVAANVWLSTRANNPRVLNAGTAIVQLMCFDRKPVVRFAYESKTGWSRSSILRYRFDQKPGRSPKARFLHDHQVIMIEQPAEVAQFVQELATSEQLFVLVTSPSVTAGTTSAEYQVAGALAAIEAAYARCPLPNNPSRARTNAWRRAASPA